MTESLILGGGCFWCVEHDMRDLEGVLSVTSGYSGGTSENPTYEHHEGHKEVVLVEYDGEKLSYKKILQFFLDHIDPTDGGGQFADRGTSYQPSIFYGNNEEHLIAESVLYELDTSHVYDAPHQVILAPRMAFYKAEEYHQDYANKNPLHYELYREGSGRKSFVAKTCQIREEKHIPWKM